jgi:hypothetical protein
MTKVFSFEVYRESHINLQTKKHCKSQLMIAIAQSFIP